MRLTIDTKAYAPALETIATVAVPPYAGWKIFGSIADAFTPNKAIRYSAAGLGLILGAAASHGSYNYIGKNSILPMPLYRMGPVDVPRDLYKATIAGWSGVIAYGTRDGVVSAMSGIASTYKSVFAPSTSAKKAPTQQKAKNQKNNR